MNRLLPTQEVTPEQELFISTYVLCNNKSRAAKKCGITRKTAHEWLKLDSVENALLEKRKQIQQEIDYTIEECINELGKIAFFDFKDIASDFRFKVEEGEIGLTLEDFQSMDTSAIQEMSAKINPQGVPYLTIKPYNKVDALKELLNRLQGTIGDKHLHVHLNEDDKKRTAKEIASNYQQMVQKSSKF